MSGKEKDGSPIDTPAPTTDDRNTIRGNWGHKIDFVLSVVGFCVGFGNVWRFPYLCYRNGGGAFLIPYFIMLVLVGIPLYFLELAIGQYSSLGPVAVWKLSPMFKGIGLTTVATIGVVTLYYNTLLAYVLFYLFASMTSELPWASCDHEWNTPNCTVRESKTGLLNSTYNTTLARTGLAPFGSNGSSMSRGVMAGLGNLSIAEITNGTKLTSPAEEYFERYVLDLSSGIHDLGGVRWQLLLCFLLAWALVFVCIAGGIQFSGKVVYFTATFPYLILVILLIRGLTLPGAFEGLRFYLVPQWHVLLTARVWGEAASQIFFSLGPAWGCLIVFASYNKFHNNCHADAIVSSLVCSGTSLLAGAVVFSIIGFMAHDLGVPISEVMASGPGLGFIVYPEAITRMPIAPFWSIIFFFMLLTVGLDSMFAQTELLVVPIFDAFPKLKRKWLVTLGVCVSYCILGIPLLTRGGFYITNMLDWYSATFTFLVIAIVENIALVYVYGYGNLAENIKLMIGREPNIFIKVCWYGVTPAITVFILIFNVAIHSPVTYNDYQYPNWAVGMGIFIGTAPLLFIPGYMIYHFAKHVGSFQNFLEVISFPWTTQTARALFGPGEGWGPMMPQHRRAAGLDLGEEKAPCLLQEEAVHVVLEDKATVNICNLQQNGHHPAAVV